MWSIRHVWGAHGFCSRFPRGLCFLTQYCHGRQSPLLIPTMTLFFVAWHAHEGQTRILGRVHCLVGACLGRGHICPLSLLISLISPCWTNWLDGDTFLPLAFVIIGRFAHPLWTDVYDVFNFHHYVLCAIILRLCIVVHRNYLLWLSSP